MGGCECDWLKVDTHTQRHNKTIGPPSPSLAPRTQAACCHAKVVRLLTKTLQNMQSAKATAGALGALRAFCRWVWLDCAWGAQVRAVLTTRQHTQNR